MINPNNPYPYNQQQENNDDILSVNTSKFTTRFDYNNNMDKLEISNIHELPEKKNPLFNSTNEHPNPNHQNPYQNNQHNQNKVQNYKYPGVNYVIPEEGELTDNYNNELTNINDDKQHLKNNLKGMNMNYNELL